MPYKVSIVVPVYHVASYIQACLRSVEQQTYKNIEVIFIDDCGTDDSVFLIKEYLSSHSFPAYKFVRHSHNRGLSAARNSGLDASTGDYVYFLDSDDTITETCIERLVASLEKKQYEVVIGSFWEQHENGENVTHLLQEGEVDEPLQSYAEGLWYVMAWNKLCSRDFLIRNRLYFKEGMLHEDVVWSFQLACLCQSMYATNNITYSYRIRSSSIMTSLSIEKDIKIYLQAFTEIKGFILEKQLTYNKYVYRITEGKKCGILYSLLQKEESKLYQKYYPLFRDLKYISPSIAYKRKMINTSYLLRDLHYCLPQLAGCLYKRIFFLLYYKLRGKQIQGAVWK